MQWTNQPVYDIINNVKRETNPHFNRLKYREVLIMNESVKTLIRTHRELNSTGKNYSDLVIELNNAE